MAGVSVNRLTNANVYLNGSSLLGKCEECTLPDLKAIMSEHKALGMVGKIELATGIDKLEAKFKWNSFYPDVMKLTHNPFKSVQLNVRSSLESYEGEGRVAETATKVFMKGQFKAPGGAGFKQHDNVETESMFNATYYKLEIGGEVIVEFDALANIFIVDGEDLLENYRANLGI
jgi:P2 family phage contractile tail tube protein